MNSSTVENTRITCFITLPMYMPVSSGTLRPLWRMDMKPDAKS